MSEVLADFKLVIFVVVIFGCFSQKTGQKRNWAGWTANFLENYIVFKTRFIFGHYKSIFDHYKSIWEKHDFFCLYPSLGIQA